MINLLRREIASAEVARRSVICFIADGMLSPF
jgi:hypothetical protein